MRRSTKFAFLVARARQLAPTRPHGLARPLAHTHPLGLARPLARTGPLAILLGLAICAGPSIAAGQPPATEKSFRLVASLYSIVTGIDDYESYGRAEGRGAMVTLGLRCRRAERRFNVDIRLSDADDKLKVTADVRPDPADHSTKAQTLALDLSDLRPVETELARDAGTGRRYVLKLIPDIEVIDVSPRRLTTDLFRIETFSFRGSPVIVNDRRYVGILRASGGELAYVGIPGIGNVEFALVPFRNAREMGTLEAGTLHIALADTTSIDIYGVANGSDEQILPGGPYQVWVRWTKATMSAADWTAREITKLGETAIPGKPDEAFQTELHRATIDDLRKGRVLWSGISSISKEDRVEP